MIYCKQIIGGLRYLRRVQNSDGGIPATKPGAVSGCWTSGETLETLLCSPYHDLDPRPFALNIIGFLEQSQLTEGEHRGGWPAVMKGKRASTMATGHATAALLLAQEYFRNDSIIIARLTPLSEAGFNWLNTARNLDGGWGVEPSGGADGKMSRMIGTVYALRAFFAASKTIDNSRIVRDAIQWIQSLANPEGGFGGQPGAKSDPCNTARAVAALLRSGSSKPNEGLVKRAIHYITRSRPRRRLWPLDTESYVTAGAPGQTVYNSNTTSDVLEAYLRAGIFNEHVEDLLSWYIQKQEEDGSWFLGANDNFVREISTWSTNEAIFPLSLAAEAYVERKLPYIQRDSRAFRRISIALGLVALVETLFIVPLPMVVTDFWNGLSEATRMLITQGVIIGMLVNLGSAFLYAFLHDKLPWGRQTIR